MNTELEHLNYNQDTGIFTWKVTLSNRCKCGNIAGTIQKNGYVRIQIGRKLYLAHRLAWLYVYESWPENEIDHINGIRDDNKISNLRDVTHSTNMQNERSPRSNNKVGILGVTFYEGKFMSSILINNKKKHLGIFKTPELAHEAYLAEKRKLHGGFML